MGGWGGKRTGAGSKPKGRPAAPLQFPLVTGGRPDSAAGLVKSLAYVGPVPLPPDDLSAEQQAFWRDHAPLAVERGTLTEATAPAFRLLCELYCRKVVIGLMVDKGALGGLRVWLQLCKQVEGLMGRFALAPFGKSIIAPEVKTDAFAEFG